ncbi:rho guanine nucleotide exchange factor 8-like isoform X3 [Salvia miltiorrhiza]|uniref:rho guanine nucleotide exchange factor 8-like isoform X3 n=1 Tax=Salvia miltiorrhiza TaxID=226208 RepID=UPI0025AC5786|nr:rho guanine nucleotide exchange factor 8-like isoform X3 [Salvia miltiorrhiza]
MQAYSSEEQEDGETVESMEGEQAESVSEKESACVVSNGAATEAAAAAPAKKKQVSEMDMMKERFAKLLLGEDMSGGGKGVSSALALSNALTNLAASVFGEQCKLEPMSEDRKARWVREVGWLVSVTDYIVEFVASEQKGKDGTNMEIMVTQQRKDLLMNIPALRKLDTMLLDTLDNFKNEQEYWYVSKDAEESEKGFQRGDKWWLPTIKVPPKGLSEDSRIFLQKQKESVVQVLKASMAINAQILSDMDVPESYMETLPKFLSTLDLSSELKVVDIKNRIEASIVIWKRKMNHKDAKASWGFTVSTEKRELFEERLETILLLLKHQFPGLPQSSLDITKIQYNKDVGLAILESYSRVLETLANTVMSRIEDVLYADSMAQESATGTAPTESNIPGTGDEPAEKMSCAANTPTSRTLLDFMGWGVEPNEAQVK